MAKRKNKGTGTEVPTTVNPSVIDKDTKHLAALEQSSDPLVIEADALVITNEATSARAHELYALIDGVIKDMQAKVKLIDDPLKDARAALKKEFELTAGPLQTKRDRLKFLMGEWRDAEQKKADALAQAQVVQVEAQAQSIAQATGIPAAEIQKTLPLPPAPQGPGRGFHTSQGAVTWRRVPKWKIVDATLIPWSWGVDVLYAVDSAVITELRRKAGEDLTQAPPGIEFYYDQTPVNSRG